MLSKNLIFGRCPLKASALSANFRKYQTPAEVPRELHNDSVDDKFLTLKNLSPAVKNVQYAVRGKVVIRAGELENEIREKKMC